MTAFVVGAVVGGVVGWLAGGRWHTVAATHWLAVERWWRRQLGR